VPGQQAVTYQQFTTERPTFAADDLLSELAASGATVQANPLVQERGFLANLLISMAPLLLMFGLYGFFLKRQQKSMGGLGGLFGSRATKPVDPETARVTFDDVAGIDEVKAEISEVVDFLKDPEKYRRVGARAPKGVLLTGAPGTGKTLLARATAGEADEEVHRISGECLAEARRLLSENRDRLDAIAKELLIHETLDEPAVYAAAGIPRPASAERVDAPARAAAWAK
jgi:cell division protease FtsH